jgi:hypothetical protein
VSQTGERIGSDIQISHEFETAHDASLSWTGSEYGLAWTGSSIDENLYFLRISSSGGFVDDAVAVMNNEQEFFIFDPLLVSAGSFIGLAWMKDQPLDVHYNFEYISTNGQRMGLSTRIQEEEAFLPSGPSVQWTGSEFGVSWLDVEPEGHYPPPRPVIYFARIGCL